VIDIFRLIAGLAVVFALLGALYVLSRKSEFLAKSWISILPRAAALPISLRRDSEQPITTAQYYIAQKSRLNPTHQLFLVCCEEERILFCAHPHGCTILHKSDLGIFEKLSEGRSGE
jgi:hypothetical protein